jgi:parallel beta-helix repeat protein
MGSDDGNNIDKDPLFTDANLHISEDSPCVDAGNPDGNYNGQTDIDGELRVQGLRADIGADEVPMHVRNVTGHNSYLSIQDAINEASNGDEIVVYPGTYYESLDFHGLSVAIRGAEPNNWDTVAATVIDGSGATSGLNFHHGETSSASLTGVTIEGSNNGIVCLNTSPTISKCIVKNNTTRGIWGFHGSPTLTNNKVFNNGNYNICLQSTANPVVRNNEIYDAKYGIWLIAPRGVAAISNNTIVRHAKRGISKTGGGPVPKITNCIVWDCKDDLYGCSASYSCIEDGDSGAGNIHLPPCFVDADNNDFHINIRNSPCVDSVNPGGNYDGQTDIDNELRLRNQRVDMGADEVWRRVRNTTNGNWYSHIQDAVNEASRGDEIVVSTGTYYESINFNGRAITVRSSNPNDWNVVAATIIDCKVNIQQLPRGQWQRCGFIFEKGEDRNSILAGFTVTNGMGLIAYDIQSGGAIFCDGSSPTIRQCILKNNDLTMTNLDSGLTR